MPPQSDVIPQSMIEDSAISASPAGIKMRGRNRSVRNPVGRAMTASAADQTFVGSAAAAGSNPRCASSGCMSKIIAVPMSGERNVADASVQKARVPIASRSVQSRR